MRSNYASRGSVKQRQQQKEQKHRQLQRTPASRSYTFTLTDNLVNVPRSYHVGIGRRLPLVEGATSAAAAAVVTSAGSLTAKHACGGIGLSLYLPPFAILHTLFINYLETN